MPQRAVAAWGKRTDRRRRYLPRGDGHSTPEKNRNDLAVLGLPGARSWEVFKDAASNETVKTLKSGYKTYSALTAAVDDINKVVVHWKLASQGDATAKTYLELLGMSAALVKHLGEVVEEETELAKATKSASGHAKTTRRIGKERRT